METNRRRSREEMEYELLDTGIFDEDRYFDVFVEYAKADPEDTLVRISVHNRGPEAAQIHVLPTLWFRNTWTWENDEQKPVLGQVDRNEIHASHPKLGEYTPAVRRRAGTALHRERIQCEPPLGTAQSLALRQRCLSSSM